MTRRLNRWLFVLLLLLGLPFYWFLIDDSFGAVESKQITIGQLRTLADSKPGPRPAGISYETIAHRWVPSNFLAAGSGMRFAIFAVHAYRVEIPDGRPVVIDTGMSSPTAIKYDLENYDTTAQARVDAAILGASAVMLLSDDAAHSDGLNVLRERSAAGPQALILAGDCNIPAAVARGIVQIPVCSEGHVSRLVYLRLADDREYLLTGDVAPLRVNWTERRAPSRLMGDLSGIKDRAEIHAWLETIGRLKAEAPEMFVVGGHSSVLPQRWNAGFTVSEGDDKPLEN